MSEKMSILRVDSSVMGEAGQSSRLANKIVTDLESKNVVGDVIIRDLNNSLPHLTPEWVAANNTSEDVRTEAQKEALALSDDLIAEIEAADVIVIGVALYNFAIPASLKAWIDLICRARKTFAYGENGPKGLLTGKKAIITFSSGGTPHGSDIDFASNYMRHILGFIGILDVEFVVAEQHFMVADAIERAHRSANDLLAKMTSQSKAA